MRFFINELSLVGQAKNIYEAEQFITELSSIIKKIKEIKHLQGDEPIETYSNIANEKICSDLTLYECLNTLKLMGKRSRDVAVLVLIMISKKKSISQEEIPNFCQCYFKNQEVHLNSLLRAAYYQGVLISFQNAEDFVDERIRVIFRENEQKDARDIVIINLTKVEQTAKVFLRYKASPKHRKMGERGEKGTLMDLTDEEGQLALNKSIAHGNQRYSYFNDKFYEFQSDNAGTFHGYPILRKDVPDKVIKKLNLQS